MRFNIFGDQRRYCVMFIVAFICGFLSTLLIMMNTNVIRRLGIGKESKMVNWMMNSYSYNKTVTHIRLLCWVMTYPPNYTEVKVSVTKTWGKRCDILLFMRTAEDKNSTTVTLPIAKRYEYQWGHTREAMKYIYGNYMDKVDWIMRADDDTYVIVESLRHMVSSYDPSMPVYFGCRFERYMKEGHTSDGAGYVISKETLRRFIEEALPKELECHRGNDGLENIEMKKCLASVKVDLIDTHQQNDTSHFSELPSERELDFSKDNPGWWYWRYINSRPRKEPVRCSNTPITFHSVSPKLMYALDYLIYGVNQVKAAL